MKGLLGKKAGMTQIFTKSGKTIPVTVISVEPNIITKIHTKEKDGYTSVQLSSFDKKEVRANRPELGHFKKAKSTPKYFVKEIKNMTVEGKKLGDIINIDIFQSGEIVDVTGISKGKGFQGAIKRHNQSRGPMSHGSKFHRAPGSSGDLAAKVRKNQTMPGHMGHNKTTIQNLEIIDVDKENNALLIKGSIPGPNKGFVVVKQNIKGKASIASPEEKLNVVEKNKKVELIAEGAKYNSNANLEMTIEEIKTEIKRAKEEYEKAQLIRKTAEKKAEELGIRDFEKMSLDALNEAIINTEKSQKPVEEPKVEEKQQETEQIKEKLESKEEVQNDSKEETKTN